MSAPAKVIDPTRQREVSLFSRILNTLGTWVILIILVIVGAIVFDKFGSAGNLLNILRAVTLLGIVATGVAFITFSKHYVDLAIPATMAFVGQVTITALPLGGVPALLAGLATGLCIGLLNGWAVGYLRLNPIIWTLAVAFFLDGFNRWIYEGRQVYPDAETDAGAFFLGISQHHLPGGLPAATILMLVLVAACHWLLGHTRFGQQVQLTGMAYDVAAMSGVRVKRVILLCFVISSMATTIAGILLTSLNHQGTFETGLGYEFNAITAVVLGGVMLQGGRGSIIGVLGGVLVIGVLSNLMTLMGVGTFGQMVVKGLIFMTVVGLTTWFARRSGRSDE